MKEAAFLVALLSASAILVSDPIDLEFMDSGNTKYRTTTVSADLRRDFHFINEKVKVFLIETPSLDNKNYKEVVSKLQKRQEKCDFQGCKRAVADEIHGALRWRACHASRIAPMLPTPNGIGSNVWFPGPLVRAAPAKMSGKCSMGFCMSCTRGAAGRTCRTTSARRPRLATGGCWSTNDVGSGNAWWRTY